MEIYCCTSPVSEEEASSSNVWAQLCTDDGLTGQSVGKTSAGAYFFSFSIRKPMFRECLLGTNAWLFKEHSAVEES